MRQTIRQNVPITAIKDYMNAYIKKRIVQDRIEISEQKCFVVYNNFYKII